MARRILSTAGALLLGILVCTLGALSVTPLGIAWEFRKGNLGLFDVSDDGTLLLLREPCSPSGSALVR